VAPIIPPPESIRAFARAKEFERWLAKHHDQESELYLRIYKKDSGVPTVTYAEALDIALCWGWIDGLKKSYDAQSFLQRFSPRRAKSVWSQINREHIARLIAAGRMTPHGLHHVEAAQADGRWQAAYASPSKTSIPDDLRAAIEAVPKARKTFATLNRANLFALTYQVSAARTPTGRAQRIARFVAMLARGETLHPNPKAKQRGETARPNQKAKQRKKAPAST
jgi:uncharacterized protein YdeI (YjbR/CyaY-like superfamily)